jgi:hypothetical protein
MGKSSCKTLSRAMEFALLATSDQLNACPAVNSQLRLRDFIQNLIIGLSVQRKLNCEIN